MREAKLLRRDEATIGAEPRFRVLDRIERARLVVVLVGVDLEDTVRRVALRRDTPQVAYHPK